MEGIVSIFGKKVFEFKVTRSGESWIHKTNQALWKFRRKQKLPQTVYENCHIVTGTSLIGPQQVASVPQATPDDNLQKAIEYAATMSGQDPELVAKVINLYQSYQTQR